MKFMPAGIIPLTKQNPFSNTMAIGETGSHAWGKRLAPKFNVLAASFGARKCLLFGFICSDTFLVSIYF